MSAPAVGPAPPPPYPLGPATARFAPGDVVRVRRADGPGHIRTPWYARGATGRVERLCGAFANPEELAARRSGEPLQPLYRVRFALHALWGDDAGPDTVDIEIYQHWLEPADAP